VAKTYIAGFRILKRSTEARPRPFDSEMMAGAVAAAAANAALMLGKICDYQACSIGYDQTCGS
jgi:hypothetical protein